MNDDLSKTQELKVEEVGTQLPADGSSLGRFQDLRRIAAGAMGCVYRAEDPLRKSTVALKVILPRFALDPVFVERFRREVTVLSGLQLAGVVRVHDLHEADGKLFYTMELIEGESLADAMKHGEWSLTDRLEVFRQLAQTVAALHIRGVCHRDIKPANVILNGGKPVLADFGIAKSMEGVHDRATLTMPGWRVGTPRYASPDALPALDEQAGGWEGADVYALGLLGYELLAGTYPFPEGRPQPREPDSPRNHEPQISEQVAGLLMAMLAPDTSSRPDMPEVVEKLAEKARVTVRDKTPHGPSSGWWLLGAGLLVGLVALWWATSGGLMAVNSAPQTTRPAQSLSDPVLPGRAPRLWVGSAPASLQPAWRLASADRSLLASGCLLYKLPVGTELSILQGETLLMSVVIETEKEQNYRMAPGSRLQVEVRLPGKRTPQRLDWEPVARQVDTLY